MLDSADAVAFLGDFGESQGAKLEFEYCKYAKKKIIHLHEEDERAVTFWTPTPKPGLYKRIIQTNISKPDGGKPKPEYLKKVIEEAQKEMAAKCRKEVIDQLKSLLAHCKTMRESGEFWVQDCEALDVAIAALRAPTREQVEALRGEWIKRDGYTECSKCEYWYPSGEVEEEDDRTPFCPRCGRPMTDEAVDIVLKSLEKLYEARGESCLHVKWREWCNNQNLYPNCV